MKPSKSGCSVASLIERYFTERLMRQRNVSTNTIASYRDTFRLLFTFAQARLRKPPSALTLDDLDAPFIGAFLTDLETRRGASARTRNLRLTAIRSFFRFVSFEEPAHGALIQRVLAIPSKRHDKRQVHFLTRPEIEAILAEPDRTMWLGRRDHTLLLLAAQTGLRLSELIGLDRDAVHLGAGAHVRCVGKGRKERCTPLTAIAQRALQAWPRPGPRRTWRSGSPSRPASQAAFSIATSRLAPGASTPAMRCACANTSNPSARAMATRVMPARSAVCTASAVGAEMATRIGAPVTAAFCTISIDTRLVRSTMPSRASMRSRCRRPISLSRALCRPTSSARATSRVPSSRRPPRAQRQFNGHHRGRALAVLGDAEAVVDRGVAASGVEAGGGAQLARIDAGILGNRLGRMLRLGDERGPLLEILQLAALAHERLVDQALGDDDMRHRGQHRDVGAGQEREVVRGLHVRGAHEVDAARVDDDQPGALTQPFLHAAGEHRMPVGRVGADYHDDIGVLHRVEVLRPRRDRKSVV